MDSVAMDTAVVAQDVAVAVDAQAKVPDANVYPIADDATVVVIQLARSTSADPTKFPSPDTHVAILAEMSVDHGQTWEHVGTTTTTGGIATDGNGELSYTNRRCERLPAGKNRLLRVTLAQISHGPAVTLDVSVAAEKPTTAATAVDAP